MHTTIRLFSPLATADIETLACGDRVLLNGTIFTARDAAHRRLVEAIDQGQQLPVDLTAAVIFYAGPSPAPPGKPIGSVGPTTASRMDPFAIKLMSQLRIIGMIGKGQRSVAFREACQQYKSVYFTAPGGIAALLHKHIVSAETVAYADLGTEAIKRLVIKDFPILVANDIYGHDLYEEGQQQFRVLPPADNE